MDPWWGAKLSHASGPKNQNIKQKRYCNKFKTRLKKKKMAWVVLTGDKHPSQTSRAWRASWPASRDTVRKLQRPALPSQSL